MAGINKRVLQPHGALRSPTADKKENGRMINPPIYPEFGGAKETDRMVKGNDLKIVHTQGR
jgi:hypothetical protein